MKRLRHVLSDQSGFSLIELLTAMIIGMVVLGALMTLMNVGFTKTAEVNDRSENAQIARQSMDRVITLFDSSVCFNASTPPLIGSDISVTPNIAGSDGNYAAFYADLNGASNTPDKYVLTYDPVADTITEQRYDGGATTLSNTRLIASNVIPAKSGTTDLPIFRYYAYKTDGTFGSPMATPITKANAGTAVRVVVAYEVISRRTKVEDSRSASVEDQTALGSPDSSSPASGACPT